MSNKTLEIVDGLSIKALLEKSNVLNNSDVISMAFLLNVGDINDLEPDKRYACDYDIDMKEYIDDFKNKSESHKFIRIWYSSMDPEDMCFYLYVNYLIDKYCKNNEVSVIDVATLNSFCVATFNQNQIKDLLKLETKLSSDNIRKNSTKWINFTKENGELRTYIDGILTSTSYSYIDNLILEELHKYNEISKFEFVCRIIGDRLWHVYSSSIPDYRINELIKINKIRVIRIENRFFDDGYNIRDEVISIK